MILSIIEGRAMKLNDCKEIQREIEQLAKKDEVLKWEHKFTWQYNLAWENGDI